MMPVRRALVAVLAVIGAAFGTLSASGGEYPAQPITLIVPFAAGEPADRIARIVGEHMSRTLGQPIMIKNVVGEGGTKGAAYVKHAPNNGYTIIMGHMGTHAASVALFPNLAYDPATDFEPVGLVAGTPILIVIRKDFPAKNLSEFIKYVKRKETKVNMAHADVGSASHTACTLLNSILKVTPTAMPFDGTGPALKALLGGQIDYMCDQIVNLFSQLDSGAIEAVAIAAPTRNPVLPNVPTAREVGLPEFEVSAWNALFAPKNTPKPIVDKLTHALNKALDDELTRRRLLELGSDIPHGPRRGQKALAELVESEVARLTPALRAARAEN